MALLKEVHHWMHPEWGALKFQSFALFPRISLYFVPVVQIASAQLSVAAAKPVECCYGSLP